MSQCVPSWNLDENPTPPKVPIRSDSNSTAPDVPMYEVAELTWENGQLSMHGLGLPRVTEKPISAAGTATSREAATSSKYTWDKPHAGGTLESIVNQATRYPHRSKPVFDDVCGGAGEGHDLVPWFDSQRAAAAAVMATAASAASNTMTMDTMVPCSTRTDDKPTTQLTDSVPCAAGTLGTCVLAAKRARVARVPVAPEWSGRDPSVSGSATCGRENQRVTWDTCEKELGMGFTSWSMGSPVNTSSGKQCTRTTADDDHDSVCHSRPQKRRDKINQRMKILQKLVPNSSKTDKASMLDEVIEYLKQLQAQVQMMSKMNITAMMRPMAMQQQLQMSMMHPLGMGLGMGIDMNALGRHDHNIAGIPPPAVPLFHPHPFMPLASWDASSHNGSPSSATVMPDPLSTFFSGQSQPMTMDTYHRMVAMYQQLYQQPPASASKS